MREPDHRAHFAAFGFVVLRSAIDADRMRRELEGALRASRASQVGTGVADVQYVPMMSDRTPYSLSLVERFASMAADVCGGAVLPVRAKGMRYVGSTSWHRDSSSRLKSVGFAAYLDPLDRETGALRVMPGTHLREYASITERYLSTLGPEPAGSALPDIAVATVPGDVILFDEHLFHASSGGSARLQWRVDYVRDASDPNDDDDLRAYFGGIFSPEWDGGYDVDAFPSYPADWLSSHDVVHARLRDLGVFALASAQEAYARSRRHAAG